MTEVLAELVPTSHIVGVSSACNFPPFAVQLPKIAHFNRIQIEQIAQINPTHILGIGISSSLDLSALQSSQTKIYRYPLPASVSDIFTLIKMIGSDIDQPTSADQLITSLKTKLTAISGTMTDQPNVLVIVSSSPLIMANQSTYIADLIHYAGAKLISINSRHPYPKINPELILSLNPDLILVSPGIRLSHYSYLSHIPTRSINPDLVYRSGPRFIDAIHHLKQVIHP